MCRLLQSLVVCSGGFWASVFLPHDIRITNTTKAQTEARLHLISRLPFHFVFMLLLANVVFTRSDSFRPALQLPSGIHASLSNWNAKADYP
jgi:hypothetical protein